MRSLRAWARSERPVLVLVGLASAVAFVAWGGQTRPMDDTVAYRYSASVLTSGWHDITDRAPGYPLILLATGADQADNALLFVLQLLAHAATILLVVDLARRLGVGRTGRIVIAALLLAPPVLMKAVYAGTEVWAELALVSVVWLLVRWDERRSWPYLVSVGLLIGAVTWVRPTFQLLVVPLAVVVGWLARDGRWWRTVATLVLPAVVVIGALVTINAVRFDSPTVTPLFPYHLSVKTALFVEELPPSEERSILLEHRDELLVSDPEHSPAAFAFDSRDELAEATGLTGPALDREVLRLDLKLLRENPLAYTQSVVQAAAHYVQVDPQEAGYAGKPPVAWTWAVIHLLLMLAAVAFLLLAPGMVLDKGIGRSARLIVGLAAVVVLYTGIVSVLLETGHPRLRAPTDPLIVLVLVAGLAWLRRTRATS